ncbi:MAG: phosphotransferase family protein [Actinobacteria bacterium]|nr:phosphotransferase family protein [Actinomycetota bacterium]
MTAGRAPRRGEDAIERNVALPSPPVSPTIGPRGGAVPQSGIPTGAGSPELGRARRDPVELARRLERWFGGRLPGGAEATVTASSSGAANGMSSETLLVDVVWEDGGEARVEHLVARLEPGAADVPVFPVYDLGRQVGVVGAVAERTSVPVPTVRWYEPDPAALGSPFFLMRRVEGRVPPDVPPYDFGGCWLYDAGPADQRALQDATVAVLAELHGIDRAADVFGFLAFGDGGGGSDGDGDGGDAGPGALRRHVAHTEAWYRWAVAGGPRSALIERGFAWLEDHWPAPEGPAVLSWGDARIGNVIYDGFRPAAVLDWEMAGLGPRELDVAWLLEAHRVFEDLAAQWDLPGMPGFLRPDDVATTYESLTGHGPRHLDWYTTYAAVQWGIVFLRTGSRSIALGEREAPADVDDLLHHRSTLERALAGPPAS